MTTMTLAEQHDHAATLNLRINALAKAADSVLMAMNGNPHEQGILLGLCESIADYSDQLGEKIEQLERMTRGG